MDSNSETNARLPSPWLTREELAKRWDVTPVTVSRRLDFFDLKPMRISSRKMLFHIDHIVAAEQRMMSGGGAPKPKPGPGRPRRIASAA